ncbi:WD repeat-containing protein 54-like [Watersipora subatra]|uniref:WD repeat-containing protein 54-like n=1 Tax=Watersipora subatra TaxID=2589382 RepID=UPI00355BF476
MFLPNKQMVASASASMLPNNLAVNLNAATGGADIVYIHKSAANLMLSEGSSGNGDGYLHRPVVCKIPTANQQLAYILIMQADWVEVAGRKILVLATQKGIKMYSGDGSALLFWHGFGSGEKGDSILFTRGITSIGSNTICVGTSSGQLLSFTVPAKGDDIIFEEYIGGHENSVTCVVARGDNLVSADESGVIIIRKHMDGTSFRVVKQLLGEGFPCNCLDIWQNIIVAGFGNGEIRIYHLSDGRLLGDIGAHARAINALHIAQGTGLCLSASEDSYVRVWQMKAGESVEVSHVYSDKINDHQLTGAQFTDNDGKSFAVTAYDSTQIFTYHQS